MSNVRRSMHVLGIARHPIEQNLAPLEHRLEFDGWMPPVSGYVSLIAPAFQEFTQHGESIEGLHIVARASGASLARGIEICNQLKAILLGRPSAWREHLGTIKRPNCEEAPLDIFIVRARALRIVQHIEELFVRAQKERAEVVYGNGGWYRRLCGIKAKPGEMYYS